MRMAISPSGSLTKPLAWITGANGLIGNYLVQTAPRFAPRWRVRALTREQFDLLDFAAVRTRISKRPAATHHPLRGHQHRRRGAEKSRTSAARECRSRPSCSRNWRRKSSSFFFPRIWFLTAAREITPRRTRRIRCMFMAKPKLAAEKIVLRNPRHLVVRTSINGGSVARGQPRFQRTVAARAANRAGDDVVHGRISFADSGGRNRAGGLGTGGEKLRRDLSRRRRGKTCRAGKSANCWSNAGRK